MATKTVSKLLTLMDNEFDVLFADALELRDHKQLENKPLLQVYVQDYINAIPKLRKVFLEMYDIIGSG